MQVKVINKICKCTKFVYVTLVLINVILDNVPKLCTTLLFLFCWLFVSS